MPRLGLFAALIVVLLGAGEAQAAGGDFTTVTCTTTAGTLVASNPSRTKLLVVNPSGQATIYHGPSMGGTTLTTSNGIPVEGGQSYSAAGGEAGLARNCIAGSSVTVRVEWAVE